MISVNFFLILLSYPLAEVVPPGFAIGSGCKIKISQLTF